MLILLCWQAKPTKFDGSADKCGSDQAADILIQTWTINVQIWNWNPMNIIKNIHRFFKKFQEYFENAIYMYSMFQTKILLLQLYNH